MTKSAYVCGRCGRPLPKDRYVYSQHTGRRFCWPGEGCQKIPRKGAAR